MSTTPISTPTPIPLVPQPLPKVFDALAISNALDKQLEILPEGTEHAIVGTADLNDVHVTYVMKFAPHGVWTVEGTIPWHTPIKGAPLHGATIRTDIKYAW